MIQKSPFFSMLWFWFIILEFRKATQEGCVPVTASAMVLHRGRNFRLFGATWRAAARAVQRYAGG
jgi:hypothetical protein